MRQVWGKKRFWLGVVGSCIFTAVATFLAIDIFSKKAESQSPFLAAVAITDDMDDPKIWAANFPHHYESYMKTVDQERTKYGGSEAVPYLPTKTDPRSKVSQSRLDEDPRLKTMWAGYAFSHDFREERGHAYMFIDQLYTKRQDVVSPPGTNPTLLKSQRIFRFG